MLFPGKPQPSAHPHPLFPPHHEGRPRPASASLTTVWIRPPLRLSNSFLLQSRGRWQWLCHHHKLGDAAGGRGTSTPVPSVTAPGAGASGIAMGQRQQINRHFWSKFGPFCAEGLTPSTAAAPCSARAGQTDRAAWPTGQPRPWN